MSLKEAVKDLEKEAVLEMIAKAGMYEYGSCSEKLSDKLKTAADGHCEEDGPMLLAAGLSNNDDSHMLLKILRDQPERVMDGLSILKGVLDAKQVLLYLPEGEETLAKALKEQAEEADVEIHMGIVDVRLLRDGCICHIETAAALAALVQEKEEPKTLVSVEKWETSRECAAAAEPKYVAFGTRVGDLGVDFSDAKAVQIGMKLYTPQEAAETVLVPELALGDGVIKVYGAGCCMVDLTEGQLIRSRKISCGKCTFCREGLLQLHTRMHEITSGKGEAAGLAVMKEIGEAMSYSCSCSIGDFGSALVLEAMEKFGNEFTDHIKKKKCTAGSCLAFVNMYIDPKKCNGCGKCLDVCPLNCMEGLPGYIHMIEDIDCNKCGKCMESCPEQAVVRTTGRVPSLPDRLTPVGRFKRY